MLTITVGAAEGFDEATQEFVKLGGIKLELEHSLASLSKWESVWEKPFLGSREMTREETLGYIKEMIVTPNIPENILEKFDGENIKQVNAYLDRSMTATTFAEIPSGNGPRSREVITAEVMYYWMVALNIPFECQYWHLNRLITLVKVINLKQSPPKKMNRREMAEQQRRLNAERRAKFKTQG